MCLDDNHREILQYQGDLVLSDTLKITATDGHQFILSTFHDKADHPDIVFAFYFDDNFD
jgi:hypothetical protein